MYATRPSLSPTCLVPAAFVANALQDLGIVVRARGRLEEAQSVFEQSLAIRRGLESAHQSVAATLHQMALLAEDRRDHGAAQRLLAQALAGQRQAFGEDHPAPLELRRTLAELPASPPREDCPRPRRN